MIDVLHNEQEFTRTCDIVTEIPKKKKKRDKIKSESKTIEPMQVDEPPAEPVGARFPHDHSAM